MSKDLVSSMENHFGKRAADFMVGSSDTLLSNVAFWYSTGCWALDATIGGDENGCGIPSGRVVELYGDEATAKSLIALNIIANVQKMGGLALLIDPEATNTQAFMVSMGVDLDTLFVAYPNTMEEVHDLMVAFLDAKEKLDAEQGRVIPAIIVWDSVASTTAIGEVDAIAKDGVGKATIGVHARAMSKILRVLPRRFSQANTGAIFVNQTREKIGVMFGDKQTTFGGKALKFYASVRIQLAIRRKYQPDDEVTGILVRSTVVKNKVDRPFGTCTFPVIFDYGIDNCVASFEYLKSAGVIETVHSWNTITLGGEDHKFQRKGWRELFVLHEEEIKDMVLGGEVVHISDDTMEEGDA